MAKHSKSQETHADLGSRESIELLRKVLTHLERVLEGLDNGLDGGERGIHQATARESARIATAISSVTGELRAREKAERRALELVDDTTLLRALRALSEERRHGILSEILSLDDTASVLA